MNLVINAALVSLGLVFSTPSSLLAQASTSEGRVGVCSLLPKEEIKKHLPWESFLDQMPIEEEAIGASGSACSYPTVHIQVLPFSQRMIDFAREKGGLENVDDLGDEAYFHNNADRYAEVYVKVGEQLLTLQADADDDIEAVKPKVLELANALVAKLR
jgi:hypothetical protein